MMKLKSKILAGMALMALATTAHAAMITGSIGFSGTANLNSADLSAATQVTSWTNPVVGITSGDFTTIAQNTPVTLAAPWSFNSGAVANFWQVGGFTFNLTNSMVNQNDGLFLEVLGTGNIVGNGFDSTPGTWRFSTQAPGGGQNLSSFTFSSSGSATRVPDGGTTLAMLGLSFLGLGGVSRLLRRN